MFDFSLLMTMKTASGLGWPTMSAEVNQYCGWLHFRGVPIFLVFVEGSIHEFQYPQISDFRYELWRKILWSRILSPTNASFTFNPQKLVPTKIKPSTVADKVFMVMSRPKSKVYYCFIKLSGVFIHKDWHIHNHCFLCRLQSIATHRLLHSLG